MRKPTPVTTSTITADNGSSRNDTSARNSPTRIHVYAVSTSTRADSGRDASVSTARSANTNAAPTAPHASHAVPRRPSRSPSSRFSATAASGRAGTIHRRGRVTRRPSSLQQVDLVHEHGLAQTEQVHDDGEPDRHFRRGHGHHEEHEHLAVHRVHRARERDEREVRGVQHQLDGHEDDERVAPDEHADDADPEQHGAQGQRPRQRNHDAPPGVPAGGGAFGGGAAAARPRPITMTPTIATSSRMDVISNGNR